MPARSFGGTYALLGSTFAAFIVVLVAVMRTTTAAPASPRAILEPVLALVVLTGIVMLLMAGYRNVGVIRGLVSPRYFEAFMQDKPAEWLERPARTYMNLLELPVLFYLACVLMLVTGKYDTLQVALAWIFVATRYVHAAIYIAVNHVPLRFVAFLCGFVALAVIWVRFAAQNLA